ncbi:flagellar protein FlaG [Paenibacillus flagellatus]|uniref:Flagellar biosynthesis protein FlaG n=1 Tax=Paenibacillus flagellatus TaxID=2211139 RepID=A0A2V5JY25_9BACL|nr:flagellar protein FlaG [Paenibacillus flagellatus]PYI51182.1 flagellar biosynthesis protein FlaG [Paenibacillus flagellatus]
MENQPVGVSYPRIPPNGSEVVSTIHTTQELKRAEVQGEHITISEEQLIRAIDKAVKAVQGTATVLDFSVHKSTNQIMVKVLERDTGRVIREIPPEKMLDFVAKLCEMAGILVDKKL